jgi:excisionase family DNA binding protein
MSKYITVDDVADMLSVNKKWVYRHVDSGAIPHVRIGKLIRFKVEDLEGWLAQYAQEEAPGQLI